MMDRWTGQILALVVLAAACSTTLGCGATALEQQADAAFAVATAAAEADRVIVTLRAADLDEVVQQARDTCGGRDAVGACNDEQAAALTARYEAREQAWAPVLACRGPVVESVRSWIDGIEVAHAASNDELGLTYAVSLGRRALLLWQRFAVCVNTAAPEAVSLPTLPGFVLGALGEEVE